MLTFPTVDKVTTQALGGVLYYVHPQVVASLHGTISQNITPAVVIQVTNSINSTDDVLELIRSFKDTDDVYSDHFQHSLVLQVLAGQCVQSLVWNLKASERFRNVFQSRPESQRSLLPSGPYFLVNNDIHQAWRLYEDDLNAFVIPTVPDDVTAPNNFFPLNSLSPDGIIKHVAVPSRLYFTRSESRPLDGSRIGIKDCYHLKGVKTTMMSLAYTQLYGPEDHSADYVEKLISLGAIIVGKTKMTAFASADEPTDMWIDYHCPINPRGDRYQSPSGSSTGAAASMAGYEWLDYSMAGDTGGSVRAPATTNGLFSLRPSFGTTSMEGIQAKSPRFDVVGLFGRSIQDLRHLAANTLDLKDDRVFPKKILYPKDFFPHSNANQQAMVEEFISILEKYLGVKRTELDLKERWAVSPPAAALGKPLMEYMSKSAFWPMCYEYFHSFAKFRKEYREQTGTDPYGGPVATFRWGIGETVTREEHAQGWAELDVFRGWFESNIMAANSELLSDAVMIMPYGMGTPKYRDSPNEAPSTSHAIGEKFLSPILEAPQVVFPIGQNAYQSKFSGRTEYRPITTSLVGAKGSDLMLMNLIQAVFESASWPTKVLVGRYTFKVGHNTRNVADDHTGQVEKSEVIKGFSIYERRVNNCVCHALRYKRSLRWDDVWM